MIIRENYYFTQNKNVKISIVSYNKIGEGVARAEMKVIYGYLKLYGHMTHGY